MVCDTLFEIVPQVYRGSKGPCPATTKWTSPVPAFLRFGSWIGGDRDGGRGGVTCDAIRPAQETILRHYLGN